MKSVYIILFSIILMSCSNDDDSDMVLNPAIDIEGSWNLVNVSGGFSGVDQDFETRTIVWDFNTSDMMVTVTNTSTITEVYDGLPTGVYSYVITPNPASNNCLLIVNEISLGGLFFSSADSFSVNESFSDGFDITFER